MGRQLLRAATSVAANYRAACRARSKAEFIAKISIVVEESDEALLWLELIRDAKIAVVDENLIHESEVLMKIMAASRKTARD